MSWISLDDLIYMMYFLLQSPQAKGIFNATAPNPVQNQVFGKTLGRALNRPAFMPLPAFVVLLTMGEMGDVLLLNSARVLPKKVSKLGFSFCHPTLESCLSACL